MGSKTHEATRLCTRSSIYRSVIDPEDRDIFRVAAGLSPGAVDDREQDATFKHHLAFVLRTPDLQSGIRDRATAADIWRRGVLLFILSAPRSHGGVANLAGCRVPYHWGLPYCHPRLGWPWLLWS